METSIVMVENYNEMKIFSSKQHDERAESLSDAEELFEMSEEQRGKFDSCLLWKSLQCGRKKLGGFGWAYTSGQDECLKDSSFFLCTKSSKVFN